MGTAGQSITLANSIIGVGILAMPFCYQQCGIILATLILLLMGLVSRLCCYFLLKSALIARKRTFEYLAFHVFGPTGKLAVEMGIIGFLMGTCIAYFVVVGDLGPQIIAKMFNINQSDILRTCLMVAVSLACVLPLGLLRDVHSLSSVSAVTLGFYFCLVIKIAIEAMSRVTGAGAVGAAGAGASGLRLWRAAGVLQCAPVLCMALFCQTQLFEVFSSFPGLSLERMSATSARAIHLCSAVYCALGAAGYAAFADQPIPGNVLMSLSGSTDSDVIKLGFVLSLCFSFPLVIFPCRASLYSFLYRRSPHEQTAKASGIPERAFRRLTVGIVACALLVSLLLPTVELVLGLVGSTAGVLVCVVFPAACFVRLTYKDTSERVLAKMTVVLGLTILVLGTVANLQALDALAPRADAPGRPEPGSKEHIDRIVEDFFQAQKLAEHRDVLSKPVQAKDKASPGEIVRDANAVDTDSEIQPPNPVPPESSDDVNNNLKLNVEPKLKKEVVDTKLKENVESKKLAVLENTVIKDKPSPELSDTGNVQTILKQVEENPQEKEEKRQLMQHKQLIETIKQHDKEQKELIKEQKEILDELHKTKKELDQNNKETGEGNKVAVESIQKIANVAIQTLTASEAPFDEKIVKKADVLNEIADEAVQEIAKKALESIVAIQEVKDKARDDVEARNAIIANPPVMEPKQENPKNMNKVPVEKFRSDLKKLANLATLAVKRNITIDNKQINQKTQNLQGDIQSVKLAPANSNPVPSEQEVANQLVRNKVDPNIVKKNEINEHSAVEVPQSIKVSEDMQKKKDQQPLQQNSIPQVPIPLAMRDMRNRNSDTEVNGESVQNRQKREVVDCTAQALRPEDRRICDALVSGPALPAVPALPSKVDFNEVLAKNVDINMIHRSLKSVRKQ